MRAAHRRVLLALALSSLAACQREQGSAVPNAGALDSASAFGDAAKDSALAATGTPPAPSAIGAFHAVGTEPFWGLIISESGLTFSTPESQDGTRFPAALPSLEGKSYRWSSSTPAPDAHRIEVTIVERPCSDGMSDKTWTHAASVRFDGRQFEGCADRGLRPDPASRPK